MTHDNLQNFLMTLKPKFVLRNPKSNKPTHLYLEIWYKGKRSRIKLYGCKVLPTHWNKNIQRAYTSFILSDLDNHNNNIVNNEIESYNAKFYEFIAYLCENHKQAYQFHSGLKDYMTKYFKRKDTSSLHTSFDMYEELGKKIGQFEKASKGKYKKCLDIFKEFATIHLPQEGYNAITKPSQINGVIMDLFRDYIMEYEKDDGEPYAISTANTKIKEWSAIFHKYAYKIEGSDVSKEYVKSVKIELIPTNEYSNSIALRDDEIIKLYNFHCDNESDEQIKDMFIILCLTGQRIGDFQLLSENTHTIHGVETVSFSQNKTEVIIDVFLLFELAVELKRKYNGIFPKMTAKKINENIGRIAHNAGIGLERITIYKRFCGEREARQEQKYRYELIKSHTGRRTFVTMLHHRGWSNEKIMPFTGHKQAKTVQIYSRMTAQTIQIFHNTPPTQKLKMVEGHNDSVFKEQCKPSHINNFNIDGIHEAMSVLRFLGVEFNESMSFDELINLIDWKHSNIFEEVGVDIEDIKAIYNIKAPQARRILALKAILNQIYA